MQASKGRGLALKLELTDILDHGLDDHILIELADTRSSRRYRNQEQVQRALNLSGSEFPHALSTGYSSLRAATGPGSSSSRSKRARPPAAASPSPWSPANRRHPGASLLTAGPRATAASFRDTYASLAPLQKACLLNLAAKAAATILGGAACLDHWLRILSVQQDRLLVRTSAALEKAAALSPLFVNADALLHAAPAGYRRTRSFKTKDPTAVCSSLVSGARSRSKIIWWTPISTRPRA